MHVLYSIVRGSTDVKAKIDRRFNQWKLQSYFRFGPCGHVSVYSISCSRRSPYSFFLVLQKIVISPLSAKRFDYGWQSRSDDFLVRLLIYRRFVKRWKLCTWQRFLIFSCAHTYTRTRQPFVRLLTLTAICIKWWERKRKKENRSKSEWSTNSTIIILIHNWEKNAEKKLCTCRSYTKGLDAS